MTGQINDGTEKVAADNTEVVKTETFGQKVRGFIAKARDWFRTYSYEVFLIAIIVTLSAFVLLFPMTAVGVGAIVAASSGWVAYFGLRNRTGK